MQSTAACAVLAQQAKDRASTSQLLRDDRGMHCAEALDTFGQDVDPWSNRDVVTTAVSDDPLSDVSASIGNRCRCVVLCPSFVPQTLYDSFPAPVWVWDMCVRVCVCVSVCECVCVCVCIHVWLFVGRVVCRRVDFTPSCGTELTRGHW
jgi:hypothetical protein